MAAATAAQHPRSSQSSEVVLICGSVFIMAEARAAIGIVEPCDSPPVREVHGAHLKAAQAKRQQTQEEVEVEEEEKEEERARPSIQQQ